jgi:hypothetical protein
MSIEKFLIAGGIEPLTLTIEQTSRRLAKAERRSTPASALVSMKPSRAAGER